MVFISVFHLCTGLKLLNRGYSVACNIFYTGYITAGSILSFFWALPFRLLKCLVVFRKRIALTDIKNGLVLLALIFSDAL